MSSASLRIAGLLFSAAALLLVSRQFVGGIQQGLDTEALRSALAADPASPFRWCDLGEAYMLQGNLEKAEYCIRHGAALAPHVPAVQLRLCNLEIRTGDVSRITACLSKLLEIEPTYREMILSDYERLGIKAP